VLNAKPTRSAYDFYMTARTIRYRVGNEHSPTDPRGRIELVIHPDGTARLDHYFSRPGPVGPAGTWTGRIAPVALEQLWAELGRVGFPAIPAERTLPPDSTVRSLTIGADGISAQVFLSWHRTPSLPGYAEAFDIIDGVIRQLSQDTVKYPTKQPQIVYDIVIRAAEN
jgi:hypothetical protein